MWEARQDVLDGGVLHVFVGRTGVSCRYAGEETFFSVRRPKKMLVLRTSCGFCRSVLVMSNELRLS
jgi:hypothetical protein